MNEPPNPYNCPIEFVDEPPVYLRPKESPGSYSPEVWEELLKTKESNE
jgi:hypothetical protein